MAKTPARAKKAMAPNPRQGDSDRLYAEFNAY
jgi:hypothetical protein